MLRTISRNVAWLAPATAALTILPLPSAVSAEDSDLDLHPKLENSYHAQLGRGGEVGMLEKWCALPNFSFENQGGISGWTSKDCNDCHIGAAWNPTRPAADCALCHGVAQPTRDDVPQVSHCMNCHWKDTSKRGDAFTPDTDVHLAAGMLCQDCHLRRGANGSNHQFLKGSALDTTEPTLKGILSCTTCHVPTPHLAAGVERAEELDDHVEKVACVTCHTRERPRPALASRSWLQFDKLGKPVTTKHRPGWMPEYKWYDGKGPGEDGDYRLPILGATARRDAPGARIHPFNPVTVTWYVQSPDSPYDDVVPVPQVKAADLDGNGLVTLKEMRQTVPGATIRSADMSFSISHSVVPSETALSCADCHGKSAWVLDWPTLGYPWDPALRTPRPLGTATP